MKVQRARNQCFCSNLEAAKASTAQEDPKSSTPSRKTQPRYMGGVCFRSCVFVGGNKRKPNKEETLEKGEKSRERDKHF